MPIITQNMLRGFVIRFFIIFLSVTPLWAVQPDVSVRAATGGEVISADTANGTFTTLIGPKLSEKSSSGFGTGTLILNAPSGFEFDPSGLVTITVTGNRKGTDLVLASNLATVTSTSITIEIISESTPNTRRSTLTWSVIKVRPTAGTPLISGMLTRTGTAIYNESAGVTNYGTLTIVPGAPTNLFVVLPGQSFINGTGVSGQPFPQTSGIPFNLSRLIVADQFANVVTNYAGSKTIAFSGPGGSPTYPSSVSFSNGQSTSLLTTILRKAEITALTASDGTISGPASSGFTVLPESAARLQILAPGETAAPGTATGKIGTPSPQTAGTAFDLSVQAVDTNWNVTTSVTDTITVTVSDPYATFPATVTLNGGTGSITTVFRTAGSQTIAVSNLTTPTILADTTPSITIAPGTQQQLQILVPGESAAPGTTTGKTGTPLGQTAGMAFTVTVQAVDAHWNVVPTTDYALLSSSDANALLPDNVSLTSGAQVCSVTLKSAGTAIMTATNLSNPSAAQGVSAPISVGAAAYSRLQILVPGESAVPGTPTGKTGTPLAQSVGVNFPVHVYAADDYWNPLAVATDAVAFYSSDITATLPGGALSDGSNTFLVALNTAGSHTLMVSNVTQQTIAVGTSSLIPVGAATFTPAAGGTAISADRAGGSYVSLTGPVIMEGAPGNIGEGTIILTLPDGFVVNTGNPVVAVISGSGSGNDIVLESPTATVSATTITLWVTAPSSGSRVSTLTWSGIQVRPSAGTPLTSGSISNTGTAILSGIAPDALYGTLTEVPGTAARLAISTQPAATATAGVVFVRQPAIRIEDQFGNPRPSDNGTVITATRDAGIGALQGSLSAITAGGTATFTNLSHRMANTISVSFSAAGLISTTSQGVVVYPASASLLAFVQQPGDTQAGAPLSPALTVQVKDAFSNVVAEANHLITLAVSSGAGTLGGTTSNQTDASGVATFADLTITASGVKTVSATAPGLMSAVSTPFMIRPASASQLAFIQPPTNAVAGSVIVPAITVQARDAYGNPVTNAGRTIVVSLSTGTGVLAGTTTNLTDAQGLSQFNNLTMVVAGSKALTATSTGVTAAVSELFSIFPGDYERVQLLVPGESAAPGTLTGKTGSPAMQATGMPFSVTVNGVDVYWNIVTTTLSTVDVYSATDSHATSSPTNAVLISGSRVFTVTFKTGGYQTLTAEDTFDDAIGDDTSPQILVVPKLFALQVISLHGEASPAPGVHTNVENASLSLSVSSPVIDGGTQYTCIGWVMASNMPFSGASNSFTLIITNHCTLTWLWATNYRFSTTAGANGSLTGATNGWYTQGQSVSVTAVPAEFYAFTGWRGDTQGDTNNPNLTVLMDQPRTLSTGFSPLLAPNGTPYWWLSENGTTNGGFSFDVAETNDTDRDHMLNWQEYVTGTDPTNTHSYFHVKNITRPSSVTFFFQTATQRLYTLWSSPSPTGGVWTEVPGQTNWGTGALSSLIDPNAVSPRYYRLDVVYPSPAP